MTRSKSKETDVSAPARPNDAPAHLAEEINQELEKGKEHARLLVEHMLRLGDLLLQAKESVGHGKFYKWLEENCQLKMRQAQRYMKVAQHREIVEKANASRATHLSLRAALEAIERKLEGKDKDSSGNAKQKASEVDHDAELTRHRERYEKFKSFLNDETSIDGGLELKRVVEKDMDKFVRDLIRVARKHGKKIATEESAELGSDQELVAMALMAEAKAQVNPMKDFAPKEPAK